MSKYINTKVYWSISATLDTVDWECTASPQEFTIKHQTDVSYIHSTPLIVLVNATSAGGVNIPLTTASIIMVWCNQPFTMVHTIHDENYWIQSVPRICMCKVDISFYEQSPPRCSWKIYIKRSQNIIDIPSHHQIILCSIESIVNSMYKDPKIAYVLQWIHHLKSRFIEVDIRTTIHDCRPILVIARKVTTLESTEQSPC